MQLLVRSLRTDIKILLFYNKVKSYCKLTSCKLKEYYYSMEWFDGEEWNVEQLQFDHSYSTTAVLPCA